MLALAADEIDDPTIVVADMAQKAVQQVQRSVRTLLEDPISAPKISPEKIDNIIEAITTGRVTHDYPITVEEAKELGFPIITGLPKIIYDLIDLYPQPRGGRPSVQYIPLPYEPPRLPEPDNASSSR